MAKNKTQVNTGVKMINLNRIHYQRQARHERLQRTFLAGKVLHLRALMLEVPRVGEAGCGHSRICKPICRSARQP